MKTENAIVFVSTVQKTEVSISADRDVGDVRKMETPSKDRVGRPVGPMICVIPCRCDAPDSHELQGIYGLFSVNAML